MTTPDRPILCRCGQALSAATYDLHMSANHRDPKARQEERDRAVIARRKASERRHIAAIAGTTEWVHDKPNLNDGRLPEGAFDWPIYVSAYTQPTEDCQSNGHRDPLYAE